MTATPKNSVKIQGDEWYMLLDDDSQRQHVLPLDDGFEFIRQSCNGYYLEYFRSWDKESGVKDFEVKEEFEYKIRIVKGFILQEEIVKGEVDGGSD